MRRICTIPDCGRPRRVRGLCNPHWKRVDKTGDARPHEPIGVNLASMMRGRTLVERLTLQIEQRGDCLIWVGQINTNGYGMVWDSDLGKQRLAHRVMYELLHGEHPDDLELDHLCRRRACVNSDHLQPVTHIENMRRGRGYRDYPPKTHCKRGHELTEENTYIKKPSGKRRCYTCQRAEWAKRNTGRKNGWFHAIKTHCKRGHEFNEENTYRNATGGRVCRACKRERNRAKVEVAA